MNDGRARAVQQNVLLVFIEHLERQRRGDVVMFARAFQQLAVPRRGHGLAPWNDATIGDAHVAINNEFDVELALNPKALTSTACPERGVERKDAGR